MSAPPFMPLYVGDYLADTTHLTCTEHGAYVLLLMSMWRNGGSLPSDDRTLARHARCTKGQWDRMRPVLIGFFNVTDQTISHGRLTAELTKHSDAVERQRERSSNGGKAKALKNNSAPPATGTEKPCQPEPEPEKKDAAVVGASAIASDDWPQGKAFDHAALLIELAQTAGLDPSRQAGLVTTTGRLHAWREAGASWEHDVVPTVTALARKARNAIASWKFFDAAIAQSISDNRQALTIPEAQNDRPADSRSPRPAYAQPSRAERDQSAALEVLARRGLLPRPDQGGGVYGGRPPGLAAA